MAYTQLTAAQVDADSPLNETLFQQIKDNLDAFLTSGGLILAGSYVANSIAVGDIGTSAVGQDEIAASAVGQGELKSTSELLTNTSATPVSAGFANSQYSFNIKGAVDGGGTHTWVVGNGGTSNSTETLYYYMSAASGTNTHSYRIQYIQASPPYDFGGIPWGHSPWVVLIRNKSDGTVLHGWKAGDPWYYSRYRKHLCKGSLAGLLGFECRVGGITHQMPAFQHPFTMARLAPDLAVGELPAGYELVMLDMRHLDEEIDYLPAAERLAGLDAYTADLAARKMPLVEIEAEARRIKADAAAEAVRSVKARRWIEQHSSVAKAAVYLRAAAGRIRRWELEEIEYSIGTSLLGRAHAGTLAELNSARSVSDDKTHKDHKHLPQIPGLFIPDMDGTPPLVRVLSAA